MTYSLHTFYCPRCKCGTAHELDECGKPHCIECQEKRSAKRAAPFVNKPHDTARHIAALDGLANRGEEKRRP